jgi:hypothetical protein
MEIAEQTRLENPEREVRSHDTTILFVHSLLALILMIGIFLDSMSSGTAPADFASMIVFP